MQNEIDTGLNQYRLEKVFFFKFFIFVLVSFTEFFFSFSFVPGLTLRRTNALDFYCFQSQLINDEREERGKVMDIFDSPIDSHR